MILFIYMVLACEVTNREMSTTQRQGSWVFLPAFGLAQLARNCCRETPWQKKRRNTAVQPSQSSTQKPLVKHSSEDFLHKGSWSQQHFESFRKSAEIHQISSTPVDFPWIYHKLPKLPPTRPYFSLRSLWSPLKPWAVAPAQREMPWRKTPGIRRIWPIGPSRRWDVLLLVDVEGNNSGGWRYINI